MRIDCNQIVFSSGRAVIVPYGIVGISPDGHYAYQTDGMVLDTTSLEKVDLVELAEHMVFLWTLFRRKAQGRPLPELPTGREEEGKP